MGKLPTSKRRTRKSFWVFFLVTQLSMQRSKLTTTNFLVFLEQANEKENQQREKLFTRESSQQEKEEQENLFGFSFYYYY